MRLGFSENKKRNRGDYPEVSPAPSEEICLQEVNKLPTDMGSDYLEPLPTMIHASQINSDLTTHSTHVVAPVNVPTHTEVSFRKADRSDRNASLLDPPSENAQYNSPSNKFFNPADPLRSDVASWRHIPATKDSTPPHEVHINPPSKGDPLLSSRWADLVEDQSCDLGPVMVTEEQTLENSGPEHPVIDPLGSASQTPVEEVPPPIQHSSPVQQSNDENNDLNEENLQQEFKDWHLTEDCNDAFTAITTRAAKNWASKPHIVITLDLEEVSKDIRDLMDHALLFYFTARVPSLNDFRSWIEKEFRIKRGWHLRQIKFVGHNYFMVVFLHAESRKKAVLCAPWYFQRRFVYTKVWDPTFDVTAEQREIPVWIEVPFRSLILEKYRRGMIEGIGDILVYLKGETLSEYPHDRACILWDISRPTPECFSVRIGGHVLWQEVTFRNLPISCFRCNSHAHNSDQCPHEATKVDIPDIPNNTATATETTIVSDNTRKGKQTEHPTTPACDFSMYESEEAEAETEIHADPPLGHQEGQVNPSAELHTDKIALTAGPSAAFSHDIRSLPLKQQVDSLVGHEAGHSHVVPHTEESLSPELQLHGSVITVFRNQTAEQVFKCLNDSYEETLASSSAGAVDVAPDNFPPLSDSDTGTTKPAVDNITVRSGNFTPTDSSPLSTPKVIKISNRKRYRSGRDRSRTHRQLDFPVDSFRGLLQQQIPPAPGTAPVLSDEDTSSCANPLDALESLAQFDSETGWSDSPDFPDPTHSE